MEGQSYSIPSSSVQFTIHAMDDIVPVDPSRYHRCTLVEAVIAPGVRLEIPCFPCSGLACHAAYLRSFQLWFALHLQCAYFPHLHLVDAHAVVHAFTSTVLLPAQAYDRCPAPVSVSTPICLATIEFHFPISSPGFLVDESIILQEARSRSRPSRIPASDRAVIDLIVARAEEEIREGAMFGRGWTGADHDCVICMEEITDPRKALKLPCRHVFHEACLLRWFQTNHVCPLCRRPVPTQDH